VTIQRLRRSTFLWKVCFSSEKGIGKLNATEGRLAILVINVLYFKKKKRVYVCQLRGGVHVTEKQDLAGINRLCYI